MYRFLLLFIWVPLSGLQAQELWIEVKEEGSSSPIADVFVALSKNDQIVAADYSDSSGKVRFSNIPAEQYRLTLSHVNFQFFRKDVKLDSTLHTEIIYMFPTSLKELPEMKVQQSRGIDTVYSPFGRQIDDFEIYEDGEMMIVSHDQFKNKKVRIEWWVKGKMADSFIFDRKIDHLQSDVDGSLHFLSDKEWYQLNVEESKLKITKSNWRTAHHRANIWDSNFNQVLMNDFQYHYPEVNWYLWKADQPGPNWLATVGDPVMMEIYRSEYKYVDVRTKIWAKEQEYATGIDAEIWVGANVFTQSIYYQPINSYAYRIGRIYIVIDLYEKKIAHFNASGLLLREVALQLSMKDEEILKLKFLQDKATGEVYGLQENAGYSTLYALNYHRGNFNYSYQIEPRYVKKIEVCKGDVYYLHRPFESIQTYYLLKERLPGWQSVGRQTEEETKSLIQHTPEGDR